MRAKQLLLHMHHMNAMKGHDLCGCVSGCRMPSHSSASCNAPASSRGPFNGFTPHNFDGRPYLLLVFLPLLAMPRTPAPSCFSFRAPFSSLNVLP